MKKRIKTNGLIIFISLVLIAIFPSKFIRPIAGKFNIAIEICGILLILCGQLLRISSRGYKSEHSRDGQALVKGGPYAMVRNPMYLGILLIGLGVILFLFNWWVAIVFIIVFIIKYIGLLFEEEKKLKQYFGQEYIDYQKQVPRMFPGLAVLFRGDATDYLPLRTSWVKKEIGSVVALLIAILVFTCWRDFRELPAVFSVIILFWVFAFFLSRHYENITK